MLLAIILFLALVMIFLFIIDITDTIVKQSLHCAYSYNISVIAGITASALWALLFYLMH